MNPGSIFSFVAALLFTLALVPVVRWVCIRMNFVAEPREDRWHRKAMPTLGGVAIFLACLIGLTASSLVNGSGSQIRWGLLAGSAVIFLVGLYDDIKSFTPQAKLVGQILATTLVVFQGYTTNFFLPRISNNLLAQIPNILLTFIWVVGISNAINLLDNMDGLAGGLSFITAGILGFFFWRVNDQSLLPVAAAVAGSALGFLVYNFPPASIFMGDSGSLFLGFTLAVLAIARQPQASNVFAVMSVPTLLFLLPILDTVLVTFTRILRGQSPTHGGRDHTSHRLIAFGLTERQAVLTLYAIALISGVIAAGLESLNYWFSLVLVPFVVLSLTLLTAYLGGLKVVSTPEAGTNQNRAITRFFLDLTYRRRLLEVILDFFLIAIAYYLAFLVRFGLGTRLENLEVYLRTLPIAWGGTYISFFVFGVYRGLWRYVSVDDLMKYIKAVIGGVLLMAIPILILYSSQTYPPVILIYFVILLFLGLTSSRTSFKILDRVFSPQIRGQEQRVLICGAGDAGEMALRWILMNPEMGFSPIGFLDNDVFKAGKQIHGVEVLGDLNSLETLLDQREIDGIILTSGLVEDADLKDKVIELCRSHGRWVRNLRFEFELIEGS
jgi:UDP-GlcNAc:undecaprenyl-phosphate GlcNAc-1-phosphate transferase